MAQLLFMKRHEIGIIIIRIIQALVCRIGTNGVIKKMAHTTMALSSVNLDNCVSFATRTPVN